MVSEIINHHVVICYLGLDMMVKLGENVPSYSIMKKWAAKFKHVRESLEHNPCPRRSVTITTQETIAKFHDIIKADRE